MSYKTNLDPKHTTIRPDGGDTKPKAQSTSTESTPAAQDTYTVDQGRSYRLIVEGRKPAGHHQAIQGILNTLTMEPAPQIEHELPYVPDLEKDIFAADGERHNDMKPVVMRYVGLEKIFMAQLFEVRETLKPINMSQLKAGEIEDLRKQEKNLEKALFECRQQLDKARLYLLWEKQNKAAAAADEK